MFKKLLKDLERIALAAAERHRISQKEQLDSFNDPFAHEIEWSPAVNGGVGFRTRTMVTRNGGTISFRPSLSPLVIGLGSMFLGLYVFLLPLHITIPLRSLGTDFFGIVRLAYYQLASQVNVKIILALLIGLLFMTIGAVVLFLVLRPIVFDNNLRSFTKGYRWFKPVIVPFSNIRAIQIVSESCRGSNNKSFRSYELNLVLYDKTRVTVVDHADAEEIRGGAETLSHMLAVPVWDFTRA